MFPLKNEDEQLAKWETISKENSEQNKICMYNVHNYKKFRRGHNIATDKKNWKKRNEKIQQKDFVGSIMANLAWARIE